MRKIPLTIALILCAFCVHSPADTVTLKTGEKLEGQITGETPADVTINVTVSPTISDERTIKREDIDKVEKTSQEELDYQAIKDRQPDPLISNPAVIDRTITALNAFLAKYPQGANAAAVKAKLDVFQQEKTHLANGDVKYYGRWISKTEASKRTVQLTGAILFSKMKEQAAAGDYTGALNSFDQLEKTAVGSQVYPQAVVFAEEIITTLTSELNTAVGKYRHDAEEWSRGVAITAEPQKSQIIAAKKAEEDRYDAILAEDQKDGIKWPPVVDQSGKILNALSALIKSEDTRLAAIPLEKINASLAATGKGREELAAKDLENAEVSLKEATSLWNQNEEAAYLTQELAAYKATATKEAAEEQKKAELAAKNTQKPTPKPAASSKSSVSAGASTSPRKTLPPEQPSLLDFFMSVPGAMTIVVAAVALLAIVAVLQKLKKPKAEEVQ